MGGVAEPRINLNTSWPSAHLEHSRYPLGVSHSPVEKILAIPRTEFELHDRSASSLVTILAELSRHSVPVRLKAASNDLRKETLM